MGAVGLPVPSTQPSEATQRISKAPTPRLKIPLFGAPTSVTSSVAPVTTQPAEYGLLLPVEPDARLLSETEMWQLAHDVVRAHPGPLDTDKDPAAP